MKCPHCGEDTDQGPSYGPGDVRVAIDALAEGPTASEIGRKGGKARAEKLSPARRREIARIAARARWHGK